MIARAIAATLALLTASVDDAESLRRTAPRYLTSAEALEHLGDARFAAAMYDLDPDIVLAVAHHESRYSDAVTREPGWRVSCGPMTPEPVAACPRDGMLAGYVRGAAHLRRWLDAWRGDEWLALLSYAGGTALVRACWDDPPVLVERGDEALDLCETPAVFMRRARLIRSERVRGAM